MGAKGKIGAAMATVAIVVAAAPASARDNDWHRRHDRDHISTGAAVGAIALVGLVAALAAKKPTPVVYERGPTPPLVPDSQFNSGPSGDPSEGAAVDACLDYIDQHLSEGGNRLGRVEQISDVTPRLNGGYEVRGYVRVETWGGYPLQVNKFKCSLNGSGRSRSLTMSLAH